VDIKRRVRT